MATVITDQYGTMERGGAPALGCMPRKLEKEITLGGVTDAADEAVQVFKMVASTLVLSAGFEIVTPTTNGITASLGTGGGGGSATSLMGETATNAAAGTNVTGGYAKAMVIIDAADYIDIEVSGDAGAAGVVRVWAVVMDVASQD